MKSKPSLGPWKVVTKYDHQLNSFQIKSNEGSLVALSHYLGGTGPARANADLIAAAPDLLEMLKKFVINADDNTKDEIERDIHASELAEISKRIIAKAKGESL